MRCSWWGMANRLRFLSLHHDDETIVFTFSALLLFGRLFSSLLVIIHPNKQRSPSSSSSSSSSAPFVRSERAREEKRQNDDTQTQTKEVSARVAFSVQITRIENAFYFCFFSVLGFRV